MGVPSLNDLAVEGTLNTNKQTVSQSCSIFLIMTSYIRSQIDTGPHVEWDSLFDSYASTRRTYTLKSPKKPSANRVQSRCSNG